MCSVRASDGVCRGASQLGQAGWNEVAVGGLIAVERPSGGWRGAPMGWWSRALRDRVAQQVDADLLSASDPDVGSIAKGQHGPVIGYKPQVARRVRGSSRGSCCPGETLRTLGNSFRWSTPARHHAGFLFGEGLATATPDVQGAPSCRGYDENPSLLARSGPVLLDSVHSIFSHAIRVKALRMENFPRHS